MAIPRLLAYQGSALFSYGFRPFFLAGALYGCIAILLWLPVYFGELNLPTAFPPIAWHVHEMLYGFLPAIITGFLLTAVPNWTGQMPLQGTPLALLAAFWLAGRLAVAFSGVLGAVPAAFIDCTFLALVSLTVARGIAAGGNWRNMNVSGSCAAVAGTLCPRQPRQATLLAGRIGIAAVIL
jgi:uncharacterized protein involved in response to NO